MAKKTEEELYVAEVKIYLETERLNLVQLENDIKDDKTSMAILRKKARLDRARVRALKHRITRGERELAAYKKMNGIK